MVAMHANERADQTNRKQNCIVISATQIVSVTGVKISSINACEAAEGVRETITIMYIITEVQTTNFIYVFFLSFYYYLIIITTGSSVRRTD